MRGLEKPALCEGDRLLPAGADHQVVKHPDLDEAERRLREWWAAQAG